MNTTTLPAEGTTDKIEILPVSLLKDYQNRADEFQALSDSLSLGLGWHYLLDLTWVSLQLPLCQGMMTLDAGAGYGILQWWLLEKGSNVISADRIQRGSLPQSILKRYRVRDWHTYDCTEFDQQPLHDFLPPISPRKWYPHLKKLSNIFKRWNKERKPGERMGTAYLYHGDLRHMPEIKDQSVDAVVSVSALEHNPPDDLRACIMELMRVLKPGGKLIVTLGAAREKDWFHEPSSGWCLTQNTLCDLFNLPRDIPSNFDRYDELFEAICNSKQLKDRLANFYFESGNNGMPWGIWDPKYQPVGIVKVKAAR
jgi:SAM-dependent methyltransferase